MAIIDLAAYKAHRGVSDTVTLRDAVWTQKIASAQSMLETFCGRLFDSAQRTEKHSGNGKAFFVVRNVPITAIASIALIDDAGTSTTVDSGDYRADLDGETGKVWRIGAAEGRYIVDDVGQLETTRLGVSPCWPEGFKNISITYTGGYTSDTMPAGLKQLALEMVDELAWGAGKAQGLQSENVSTNGYNYARGAARSAPVSGVEWWQSRALTWKAGGSYVG